MKKILLILIFLIINKIVDSQTIDTSEYITGDYNQNLCIASYFGYENEVLRLINKGVDVNCDCGNGVTPILYAIEKNNYKLTEIFLKNKAQINFKPYNGISPLHAAVINGNIEIIDLLLNYNADIEIKDFNGATPLMYAIVTDQIDITKHLLEKGASINTFDYMYNSLLIVASYAGNTDIVEFLIKKGVDVNAKNYYGFTPLHLAIQNGYTDIAEILIENGAKVDVKNKNNYSPLHIAILNRDTLLVNFLIEHNANCKEKISTSFNSMGLASMLKYQEIIDLLKSKKCSANLLPYFYRYSIGYEYLTSSYDIFYSFNVRLSEMKFKYSIYGGYAYRPYDLKVKKLNSTYFYEKRNIFNIGFSKNFDYQLRKNFSFILSPGCALNYSWAYYVGTSYKPSDNFTFSFNFVFAFDYKIVTLETGYRYLDLKINENSKHWINFGLYININRKFRIPNNHKIQWLEDLL